MRKALGIAMGGDDTPRDDGYERGAHVRRATSNDDAGYPWEPAETAISASIGVATFPESGATTDSLLRLADEAMYQAKQAGKRRVAVAQTAQT